MSRVGEIADIESVLQEIGKAGALPEPFAADPGSLFLAIHHQWVRNGGRISGKPRNSIQNLMDLLEGEGTPVPSLRSKLNGETRLKVDDARALLDIYFSRWTFVAAEGENEPGYRSLEISNSEKTCGVLLQALFAGKKVMRLPEVGKEQGRSPRNTKAEHEKSAAFLAGRDVMPETFKASKVLTIVSRVGSVKGSDTTFAIRGFCQLIDEYWRIDRADGLDRVLIWIVDPGDRDIANDGSLAAFANAEQLATHFRTVRLLGDPDAAARWAWLSTHAVVVVGSQDTIVMDRLYVSHSKELRIFEEKENVIPRGIKYSHFLLDTPPIAWLRLPQLAYLYGGEFEDLERSSFVLSLDEHETRWSYLGYAQAETPIPSKDGKPSYSVALELESPGPNFDRVASIVHAAACFRLDSLRSSVANKDRLRSAIILKHQDFAVFRLPEFLNAETLSKTPP